jgi:hypothetical protein
VRVRAATPLAAEWLTRAHEALQARAASIPEAALRQGFLHNIPFQREIIAAWAARNAGGRWGALTSRVHEK